MIGDVIHFFDPLWITFSVIWFELHHLTVWHFINAILSIGLALLFSGVTSEGIQYKFAWSFGGIALLLSQLGQNDFLTDFKVWVSLGIILPQIQFIIEVSITTWKILVEIFIYAVALSIWIWTTLIKIFQWIVWLFVTISHLAVWAYFTGRNTIELVDLFFNVNFYKVIYKEEETPEFIALREYYEWFKNNWQAQNNAISRDYNREWYMGKRFYYENAEPARRKKNNNQSSNQSSSGQKQSNDNSQNNGKKDYEEAYEKYKRDNGYTNQQQQKSSEEKKYKDEYAQFYSSSYFVRLGVSTNATFDEIKQAWKKLQKKYHPDLNPSNTEEFTKIIQQINEAFEYFEKQYKKTA